MSDASKPKIAFLGTGLMGAPMCCCLLKAGFELTVWNRTASKAEALHADYRHALERGVAARRLLVGSGNGLRLNPVLREGNSDRRVAVPVKAYAQKKAKAMK